MDHQHFDDATRALATGASRRWVLKGLATGAAGGALALLSAGPATAKRKSAKKAKKVKPGLCHWTGSATNPYVYIRISESAVPAHQAHGDPLCPPDDACVTYAGCDEFGSCVPTFYPEAACTDALGAAGLCDALGACVPTAPLAPPV